MQFRSPLITPITKGDLSARIQDAEGHHGQFYADLTKEEGFFAAEYSDLIPLLPEGIRGELQPDYNKLILEPLNILPLHLKDAEFEFNTIAPTEFKFRVRGPRTTRNHPDPFSLWVKNFPREVIITALLDIEHGRVNNIQILDPNLESALISACKNKLLSFRHIADYFIIED